MKIKTADIILLALLAAIMVTAQVALSFLPNIELVTLLCIVYTIIYGKRALFIIYTFVVVEGFIFGISMWWFNYLYIWTIIWAITMPFRKQRSVILWSVISGFFGLCFGFLCSFPYFITGGIGAGISYWISGIPFDITHAIGNFFVALILWKPIYLLFDKMNNRISLNK